MQIRPELIADLKRDEGLRLTAYPDPLTRGEPWTIGYGHCGPEVHNGLTWTETQCSDALLIDASCHAEALLKALPWVSLLDPVRQDALFNMAFNLGVEGVLGFRNTLAIIRAGKYVRAAKAMRTSLWAKQVSARAGRLAKMMETGKR